MSNSNGSSSNRILNPNAREAMDRFKMEAANEVGVNLKNGDRASGHCVVHIKSFRVTVSASIFLIHKSSPLCYSVRTHKKQGTLHRFPVCDYPMFNKI